MYVSTTMNLAKMYQVYTQLNRIESIQRILQYLTYSCANIIINGVSTELIRIVFLLLNYLIHQYHQSIYIYYLHLHIVYVQHCFTAVYWRNR